MQVSVQHTSTYTFIAYHPISCSFILPSSFSLVALLSLGVGDMKESSYLYLPAVCVFLSIPIRLQLFFKFIFPLKHV